MTLNPQAPAYTALKPRYQRRAVRNAVLSVGLLGLLAGRSTALLRKSLQTQTALPGILRRIRLTNMSVKETGRQLKSLRLGMQANLGAEQAKKLRYLHTKLSNRLLRLKSAQIQRTRAYRVTQTRRKQQTRAAKKWRNAAIWATPLGALATGYPLAQYGGMRTHARYETPIRVQDALIKDTGLRHPQPIVKRRKQ